LLQQFTRSLSTLYNNPDVCKWLGEHVSLLGQPVFRLAKHLCQHPDAMAYNLLEISRVCHLPRDLPGFATTCKLLEGDDNLSWVLEHLNECKFVQKVSYVDFVQLVLDLTEIRWANTLKVHKPKIICQPMTKWQEVIKDLVANSSGLVTDGLGWQQAMKELADLHGPLAQHRALAHSQDPNSLTATVLEQVRHAPN